MLEHYRQFGYYPSPQVLQALRRINLAKPGVFRYLEGKFGVGTLSTLTLQHPETLWLRHFVTYLSTHHALHSVIWLHDGIWVFPRPSDALLAAANLHASSHLDLPPLDYTLTDLRPFRDEVYGDLLRGSPPPDHDPPFSPLPPRPALHPPLQEPTARAPLLRMMRRSALPRDCIVIDD